MQLQQLLDIMNQENAQKLNISRGKPPEIFVSGQWKSIEAPSVSVEELNTLLKSLAPDHLQEKLFGSDESLEWRSLTKNGACVIQLNGTPDMRVLTLTREGAALKSTFSPPIERQISSAGMLEDALPEHLESSSFKLENITGKNKIAAKIPLKEQVSYAPRIPSANSAPKEVKRNDFPRAAVASPPPLPRLPVGTPPAIRVSTDSGGDTAEGILTGGAVLAFALFFICLIGYFVMSAYNNHRDYSVMFNSQIVEKYNAKSPTPTLSQVELTHDEEHWQDYEGTGRFSDGDTADISAQIANFGRFGLPDKWSWNVTPHNYGPVLAGGIREDVKQRVEGNGARLQHITLNRVSRAEYKGGAEVLVGIDSRGNGITSMIGISVRVLNFNPDGSPNQYWVDVG
jgi:hypothetical protein